MLSSTALPGYVSCPFLPGKACFKTHALGGAVAELQLSLECGWALKEGRASVLEAC